MKNTKAIIAAAVAAAACTAMADILYWQVKDAKFPDSGRAANFEYATVRNGTGVEAPADKSTVMVDEAANQYYKLYTVDAANNAAAKEPAEYKFYSDSSHLNSTLGEAQWFGDIDDSVSKLLFELWDSNDTLVGYINMGRDSWSPFLTLGVQASAYNGGALQVTNVTPEPTSGLLLLLGAGALALRRRRFRALAAFAAMFCAASSYAAQNDALLTFSTKGPDKYADGAQVMDGERYALVWTPAGSKGAQIAADGTVEGGEIVLVAPVAKGGRCPRTVFQIDASLVETRYAGGTWSVYLLDTRSWGADGVAKIPGTMKGVNAAGLASGQAVAVGAGSATGAAAEEGAVAGAATALPAAMQGAKPRITAVRIEGGNVFVTAKGTFPCLQYDLFSGDEPGAVSASGNSPRGGAASPEEEVVFVAPAKKGASFFKVGRK